MKILIVTGIFPPDCGGPASYVPKIAEALIRRQHEVEVICLSDSTADTDSHRAFAVVRIRRGLWWPARVLATVSAVWRRARSSDVVYVNGLSCEATLAAILAGRPTVHKIVGDYAWERAVSFGWYDSTIEEYQAVGKPLRFQILDFIRTIPLRFASKVIVPSRYLSQIVAGWEIDPGKIRLIYNAVNGFGATSVSAPKLPEWDGHTLITICRLVPWKCVDEIIRVLRVLPTTRLLVVGSGGLMEELRSLAAECGVSQRVLFLGAVSQTAVGEYLHASDAFILNSTYEGLPHVILEAMAAGVPVIATKVGGNGEVIEHEENGLLIPPRDSGALKNAIERLWREPQLCARLSGTATVLLEVQFGFERMLENTESVLLETVAQVSKDHRIVVEGIQ